MSNKPYRVAVEVTITYITEVHADDQKEARARAWGLNFEEVEALGSIDKIEITAVSHINDIEEIQKWGEEDE